MSDYHITEEDIDTIVRYLKIFHPENANRDQARTMLEAFKAGIHKIALNNPDDIELIYQQVESKKINN